MKRILISLGTLSISLLICHLFFNLSLELKDLINTNFKQSTNLSINSNDQIKENSEVLSATTTSSKPLSKNVQVFAQIGENHLTIEGYTAPGALVELSTGLFTFTEKRYADSTGYFIFSNILLPPLIDINPCLTASDKNRVTSSPLCLAGLPFNKDLHIKGIVLPPTIFVEKNQIQSGVTTYANGFTTPNTTIDLFLFREEKKRLDINFINIIKPANALGAPRFTFKSDKNGYFEFNLPSYLPTTYRMFVAGNFQGNPSPKSNTLTFKVLSFYEQLLLSIYNLLYLIASYLKILFSQTWFVYLFEIFIIFLLLFLIKRKKKSRALLVIEKNQPSSS